MTIVIVAGCMSFSVGCSKTERTEIDDTSGGSSSQTDSGTPVGALPDGTEADAGGEETPAEAFPECPRNLIQGFAPNDTLPVVTTSQFDEYADCIRACPQGSNSCYMACPYFEEVDSCLLNQTASCSTQEGALCRSKHETTECCASDRMCGFSIQCVLDNCGDYNNTLFECILGDSICLKAAQMDCIGPDPDPTGTGEPGDPDAGTGGLDGGSDSTDVDAGAASLPDASTLGGDAADPTGSMLTPANFRSISAAMRQSVLR